MVQKKIEKTGEDPKNELSTIENNPELAQLFKDNADVGVSNLASSLPILKVHATGKSSTNELADGTEPSDGYFFYKPTQQQYKEVEIHVLSISKGYYAKSMTPDKKDQFNQILAGVILNDGAFQPFLMFFSGIKLQNLWQFGKEANPYTKRKPVPIPMFTMKVRLTSEKIKTDYGMNWVVKFQLERGMNGFPLVITDVNLFKTLRDLVDKIDEQVNGLIESKSTEEAKEEKPEDLLDGTDREEVIDESTPADQNVDPDSIPF